MVDVQAVNEELAVHFSALFSRLCEVFRRYGGRLYVDVDWWLSHAVVMYAEENYVQVVADNGLYLVIDLRPLTDGRAPYYVIDHLAGGDH